MAQGDRIVLRNVIGSYMHVVKPQTRTNDDGKIETKYSMQVVMDKDHPQLGELKAAIMEAAKARFPKVAPGKLKLGLRDADKEGTEDPNMVGKVFFNCSSFADKHRPQVINRGGRELTEDEIWSGCLLNVSIRLFGYDTKGNKGIGFGIGNVQLVEQRERWDGRKSAVDDFGIESDFEDKGPPAAKPAASADESDSEVSDEEGDGFVWE